MCLYDPPGNTFGAYGANVQASASASGPVDEIVPPFLREAMKREALAMETAALATNFVPSPGGPRSIAAAAMTRAGELSDPQAAANVLLRAPTPALNFLAKSYDLPPFRVRRPYP